MMVRRYATDQTLCRAVCLRAAAAVVVCGVVMVGWSCAGKWESCKLPALTTGCGTAKPKRCVIAPLEEVKQSLVSCGIIVQDIVDDTVLISKS